MKIGQKWPENEMQECKVIYSRTLTSPRNIYPITKSVMYYSRVSRKKIVLLPLLSVHSLLSHKTKQLWSNSMYVNHHEILCSELFQKK